MQHNNILDAARELHTIADIYKDHLTTNVLQKVSKESGMVPVHKIADDIEKIQAEGRLLNLGVIGRVKAGKSSLLNSMFFNGQSVLPKAATPMTAALTTMTFGEQISAEVQFYTAKELDDIRTMANEYDQKFTAAYNRHFEAEKAREEKRTQPQGSDVAAKIDTDKLEKKARRKAKDELGDAMELEAASMQNRDLANAAARPSDADSQRLTATSIEDLKAQLGEYVGSKGQFTPYTKSVDLFLPFEELKGIKVIDTPGVNDPIVSREVRTNQLLMQCDVILIVAPADKYFDTKDQQLVSRLTTREGLQHIYFIASQCDRALNAPEYMNELLSQALPSLTTQLARHLDSEINKMANAAGDNSTVDALRGNDGKLAERFVLVSAMSDTIAKKLASGEPFEDDEVHAKALIEELFESEFQRDQQACLAQLSGVEKVRGFIEQSRSAKTEIIAQRCEQVISQYRKILNNHKDGLLAACKERQQEIVNTDLVKLAENKHALETMKVRLENALDGEYQIMVRELDRDLSGVDRELSKITESLQDTANESLQTESSQRAVKSGWWIFGSTSYVTDTTETVNASIVSTKLSAACKRYEMAAKDYFNRFMGGKQGFEVSLTSRLFKEFSKVNNEAADSNVSINDVTKAIRNTIASIPIPKFSINVPLPSTLKESGKLSGRAATDFHSDAVEFVSTLESKVSYEAGRYIRLVESALPKNFSSGFFESIDEDIKRAKDDIDNKHQRLLALGRCATDLEKVEL